MAGIPPKRKRPSAREQRLVRRAAGVERALRTFNIPRKVDPTELAKHTKRVRIGEIELVVVPVVGGVAHYTQEGKLVRIQIGGRWFEV